MGESKKPVMTEDPGYPGPPGQDPADPKPDQRPEQEERSATPPK